MKTAFNSERPAPTLPFPSLLLACLCSVPILRAPHFPTHFSSAHRCSSHGMTETPSFLACLRPSGWCFWAPWQSRLQTLLPRSCVGGQFQSRLSQGSLPAHLTSSSFCHLVNRGHTHPRPQSSTPVVISSVCP